MTGVTEKLARFVAETPGNFLTKEMLDAAKAKFLDTIGIMVRGAQHPSGRIALEVARGMGGMPTSTLFFTGGKTSSPLAGFVNGVSAHALEYDDYTRSVGHISVCLVPGCLAVAEECNVSGRSMLEAFALGFEVTTRIAKGLRPVLINNGWHPIGIVGGQGVAVSSCRMMGLDADMTRMAMGIMGSSGGGLRKNVGSMGKAFHVGHGVKSGIFSCLLAKQGFKVDPDIIEGSDEAGEGHQRFGLADTFNGIGRYRLNLMVDGLGKDLELVQNTTMVRMHPGSTAPAAPVDALIEIAQTRDLRAEDIIKIQLDCTPQCVAIAPYQEPSDEHKAKFCLPYMLAIAFIDRKLGLSQYEPKKIADERVRSFMKRIDIVSPEDLQHHRGQWGENGVNWGESRITITLANGETIRKQCSYAKGWPEDPASWEDLMSKYIECTKDIFSKSQIEETSDMIKNMENMVHVTELTRALVPRK
jgi:2-methylcitrate dehydratase PrpD